MAVRSTEHTPQEYEPPEVVDYGDLVELTAQVGHGHPSAPPHDPLHPVHPDFSS